MNLKLLAPPTFDRVKYMQHAAFLKLVAANASPNETSLRFEDMLQPVYLELSGRALKACNSWFETHI